MNGKIAENPNVEGAQLLHGGRTLKVTVYINTDEDAQTVARRIDQAAKGPKKKMILLALQELTGDVAKAIWEEAWSIVESAERKDPIPGGSVSVS